MIEFILFIIFLVSLCGAIFILARKAPVLSGLPQHGTTGIKKHRLISDVENKIKDIAVFFEKQIFLHKFLSWVKVMTLRLETKTDKLLHKIRKKAQEVDKNLKK